MRCLAHATCRQGGGHREREHGYASGAHLCCRPARVTSAAWSGASGPTTPGTTCICTRQRWPNAEVVLVRAHRVRRAVQAQSGDSGHPLKLEIRPLEGKCRASLTSQAPTQARQAPGRARRRGHRVWPHDGAHRDRHHCRGHLRRFKAQRHLRHCGKQHLTGLRAPR